MAAQPEHLDHRSADERSHQALHSAPPAPPTLRPGAPSGRPAESGPTRPTVARTATAAPATEAVGRHCWIYPPRECSHTPRAGLLLQWRRTSTGYEGLVVYLADLAGGRALTQVQEWVPASCLRPPHG